jgi:type I restriction enzyme R subunit
MEERLRDSRPKGVVRKIAGTSRQLKEAIQKGARIIVTTIE